MNEYKYDEIQVGLKESFCVHITKEMEDSFRTITGDMNPLHIQDDFARASGDGKFPGHVTFGMMTASFYSTLAGVYIPGKYSLIHSVDLKFLKPVFAGNDLTVTGEVVEKVDALKLIQVKCKIVNEKNEAVSKAGMKIVVLR